MLGCSCCAGRLPRAVSPWAQRSCWLKRAGPCSWLSRVTLSRPCWQRWGSHGVGDPALVPEGARGERQLFHSWPYPGHGWGRGHCCGLFCGKLRGGEAHGAAECMESVMTGAGRSQCGLSWTGGCNSSVSKWVESSLWQIPHHLFQLFVSQIPCHTPNDSLNWALGKLLCWELHRSALTMLVLGNLEQVCVRRQGYLCLSLRRRCTMWGVDDRRFKISRVSHSGRKIVEAALHPHVQTHLGTAGSISRQQRTKDTVTYEHSERGKMFCCLMQTGLHTGERQQGTKWPDSC